MTNPGNIDKKRIFWALIVSSAVFIAFSLLESDILTILINGDLGENALTAAVNSVLPYSFQRWVLYIALFIGVYTFPPVKPGRIDTVLSLLFSVFLLAGWAMESIGSFSLLFHVPAAFAVALLVCILSAVTLLWLFQIVKLVYAHFRKNEKSLRIVERSWSVLTIAIVIFTVWIPIIVLRYPAGIEHDGYYQICQYYGIYTLSDINPPASTFLIGSFVRAGELLFGSYNIGAFCYVVFQAACCSLVLAYSLMVMKRIGVSDRFVLFTVLVYMFSPIFCGYTTSVIKDTPFSISVLLLVSALSDYLYLGKNRKNAGLILISSVSVLAFRGTGIVFVVICLLITVFAFAVKREKSEGVLCVLFSGALVIWACWQFLMVPAAGVEKGSSGLKETLAVPLQQTALFCKTYPEEVTVEEKEIISRVLDYEKMTDRFDINLSDPVKELWHGSKNDLGDYFSVYFRQMIRHPGVYANAFLGLNYGFYYPSVKQYHDVNSGMYRTVWNSERIVFEVPERLLPVRSALMGITMIIENFPLFYPLCNVALHSWLLIFIFIKALGRKKSHDARIMAPCFLWLIGCLFVPTFFQNGVRYALPFVWPLYLLTGLCFFPKNGKWICEIK